jgi:S-DNA-T family DNA segregation ATPase FtsK/SpoIIIE
MRKEIIGISLFFLVVFTLISLLSYSPADPSINHATSSGHIHNFFGLLGAQLAGILIGPFGLGAFWVPVLLLLTSIHFFRDHPSRAIVFTITGGVLLVITTGSLLAIYNDSIIIFGNKFSSGGIIGIFLKSFLIKYSNLIGSVIILVLLWIIGLILATGFSLTNFSKRSWRSLVFSADRLQTLFIKWKERRKKSKKSSKIKKELAVEKDREIKIKAPRSRPIKETPVPRQEVFEFMRSEPGFRLPSINLLDDSKEKPSSADNENLRMQSKLLEKKLDDFSVKGKVVAVSPGPVITTYEYEPAPGIKINKIVNLTDDLALALRATSIRIVAPIPGKAVIGIELPNTVRELVKFKGIAASSAFEKSKSKLTICLGKNIVGEPVVAALDKMPHLLIAGATGTGKSVALNAMICSLLYKSTPDEAKLIMIDPK